MVTYKQGDIIVMDFNPQKGHEQSGRRPALVLSNDILNHHSSMSLVCPITNTNKKHPFHIELDERTQTTGVILCDRRKCWMLVREMLSLKKNVQSIYGTRLRN